jgi:hypothetical protein
MAFCLSDIKIDMRYVLSGWFPSLTQWKSHLTVLFDGVRNRPLFTQRHSIRIFKWTLSVMLALWIGSRCIRAIHITPETATYFESVVWAPLAVAMVAGSSIPNIDG